MSARINENRNGSKIKARDVLTVRERLILKMVVKGCTNQQVADRMLISVDTVKKHLKNSYKKLGVHNRLQALHKAGLL